MADVIPMFGSEPEPDTIGPRPAVCEYCGESFTAPRAGVIYCGGRCRAAAWRVNHGGRPRSDTVDLKCRFPQLGGATGYRYGCRCPRCLDEHRAPRDPICIAEGCSTPRLKGYRICAEHLAERDKARATHIGRSEFVCRKCGRGFAQYESVIARQREDLQDFWRWACPGCRKSVMGQVRAHQLDSDQAWHLLTAETCDLCDQPFRHTKGERTDLVIDHDHGHCPGSSGCSRCVRGFLHANCNTMLGQVQSLFAVAGWDRVVEYLGLGGGAGVGVDPPPAEEAPCHLEMLL